MSFYTYRQNNSGGVFDYNDTGISKTVIIEADSADEADDLALGIGIYFDDDYEYDCECYGQRWGRTGEYSAHDEPSHYEGAPVGDAYLDTTASTFNIKWMDEGKPETFIHYKDGRVEGRELFQ